MNTKEKQEFLQSLKYCDSIYGNEVAISKLEEIQRALGCGEKYEKMWEELRLSNKYSEAYDDGVRAKILPEAKR